MGYDEAVQSFCGPSWSNMGPWDNTGGYLNPCFEYFWLFGSLFVYVTLAGIFRVIQVSRYNKEYVPLWWGFYVKMAVSFIMITLGVALLIMRYAMNDIEPFQSFFYGTLIFCWFWSAFIVLWEHMHAQKQNWVLILFWMISFMLGAVVLQTLFAIAKLPPKGSDASHWWWEFGIMSVMMFFNFIIACLGLFYNHIPGEITFEQKRKKLDEEKESLVSPADKPVEKITVSPEDNANIISQIVYWWINPLLYLGHERALEESDLYPLAVKDRTKAVSEKFQKNWENQLQKPNPSLFWALAYSYGLPFIIAGFIKLFADILTFAGPILLNRVVVFIGTPSQPLWEGLVYAAAMLITSAVQSLSIQIYFHIVFRVGMHLRAAVVTMVYGKSFKLSPQARQASTVGEIVNYMSIDAQRLMDLVPYLHMIWSGPLQAVIAIVLLYFVVSWSVFVGISVMFLMIPVNMVVIRKLGALQKLMMESKDKRVKLMNEVLQGIRVIKFFAWEESFEQAITVVRNEEMGRMRLSAYLKALIMFFWASTPLLVSLCTFATYTLAIEDLSPAVAFTALSLFNILRFPLNMLPTVISGIIEARVAIVRLGKYMAMEELDPQNITRGHMEVGVNKAVLVSNANFAWILGEDENEEAEGVPAQSTSAKSLADIDESTAGNIQAANEETEIDVSSRKPLLGSEEEKGVAEKPAAPKVPEKPKIKKGVILKDINFTVEHGSLTAIVGAVGAGKSTILHAFLGDIHRLSGSVEINGTVAYVAQEAWIRNATVKENILFGYPYDEARYQAVIKACELVADLNMLPAGDNTEIGEKGINLSGGQKQRISMARAVYSDADVYLLDDPLSAVDAHVGKAIFDHCICGLLKRKTRILVTHQLQYLSRTDQILVLSNKTISECGTFEQLMSDKGKFESLITTHIVNSGTHLDESVDEDLRSSMSTAAAEEGEKLKDKAVSLTSEAAKLEAGKIVKDEEREIGQVRFVVYKHYAIALGGFLLVAAVLLSYTFDQASAVMTNVWLSWWSDVKWPQYDSDFYLGIYAAIGGFNMIFMLLRSVLSAYAALNSAKSVHERVLSNVLRVPMSFFDTTPTGRILNRFSKDQYVIDETLPRTMMMFLVMIFACIAIGLVIASVTPFFLVAILPLAWLYRYVQTFYIRTSRELKRLDGISRSPIYAQFTETLTGMATIRAFDKEEQFILENEKRLDLNQTAYFLNTVTNRWLGVRLEFVGTCVVFFATLFAVLQRQSVNAGSAGLSISYSLNTTALLNWLVRMVTEVETQMVSVERMIEYAEIPREAEPILVHSRPPLGWPSRGEVEFENYQLRYREGLPLVLKGINAKIKSQEKIGVVGRTGAGKSSLMLALFRLVEPAGGTIKIDGLDITTIGTQDLRRHLSIIPQDPTLFTGTIRTNLDPFKERDDTEIWRALEDVHMKEAVIAMDDKLDAKVAEYGSNLSVGQRQLLCLGRALLRKAKILLLDEVSSACDFETDSLIQKTIRTEFKNCTVLTIAHRIHTIADSDRVLVLDQGVVVEFDSPANLLKDPNSIYYGLASKSGLKDAQ